MNLRQASISSRYVRCDIDNYEYYRIGWIKIGENIGKHTTYVNKGMFTDLDYHVVPYGKIKTTVNNVSCDGSTDVININVSYRVNPDDQIDWHIRLNNSSYVNELNDFILNEVEPWFLGLQNMTVGAQARSNYTYASLRRAKYNITVGHLVSPMTDPGDYVVNQNGHVTLQAGEAIDVFPGTTFKEGCHASLTIEYLPCQYIYGRSENNTDESKPTSTQSTKEELPKKEFIENSEVRVFPNPSDGSFTLVNMQDVPITHFEVYNLSGNLVLKQSNIDVARFNCTECLSKGVYIVHVYLGDSLKQLKIVVP